MEDVVIKLVCHVKEYERSCQETKRWMNDEELQARVPKAVSSSAYMKVELLTHLETTITTCLP